MVEFLGITVLALLLMFSAANSLLGEGPYGLLPVVCGRQARKWWRDLRPREDQWSGRIRDKLRRKVHRADRGRCVFCGGQGSAMHVDHMIPWIMGGLTALINCALLCEQCNLTKSCYWVSPAGKVYYHGGGPAPAVCADILAAERRARLSPWRWLRAYRLLPAW